MERIQGSVGVGGRNAASDVQVVQELLNRNGKKMRPYQPLKVDGRIGPKTVAAIRLFQKQVVGFANPDGRVDVGGKTFQKLSAGGVTAPAPPIAKPAGYTYFTHVKAGQVQLTYGDRAVKMVPNAELLLKSILASCDIFQARLTSTKRTYHDQARITMTQTYVADPAKVARWYGQDVLDACEEYLPAEDIQGFADWWKARDEKRGRVSSRHLSNQALDVAPSKDRAKFADAVAKLVPVVGSGVRRIIPKGVMGEPVDHVEFTFKVCSQ